MNTTTTEISLVINRFIKAPRERVFEAWTTPENLMRWFGPGTCRVLGAKMDPRKGGAYSIQMQTAACGDGEVANITGVYREFTPPSRLVFTWQWDDGKGETLVTVDLTEVQGGTNVALTHEGFTDEETRDNHSYGWNGALDKLERRADATEECRTPGHFSWNELLTSDVESAKAFYSKLFGWEPVAMPGGMPYTLFKKDGVEVAGLMKSPGPGAPSQWVAYITVASTDDAAAKATGLGSKILVPPFDIPNVGRIALLQDLQGATFGFFQPSGR